MPWVDNKQESATLNLSNQTCKEQEIPDCNFVYPYVFKFDACVYVNCICFETFYRINKKEKKPLELKLIILLLTWYLEIYIFFWSCAYTLIICQHMCKNVCLPFHLAFAILIHSVVTALF